MHFSCHTSLNAVLVIVSLKIMYRICYSNPNGRYVYICEQNGSHGENDMHYKDMLNGIAAIYFSIISTIQYNDPMNTI